MGPLLYYFLVILAFFLSLIAVYLLYMTWHFGTFNKMGIPGPEPTMVLGNTVELMKKGLMEFDIENMKKYGKIFGMYIGRNPKLVVGDDAFLKEMLVKQFNNFTDRQVVFEGMNGYMEEGVNIMRAPRWKDARSLITQTFTSGKLKKMTRLLQDAAESLVNAMKVKAAETEELELKRFCGNYTMDVIASTAFGVNVDSNNNPDDPFVKNAEKFISITLTSPIFMIQFFLPFLVKPLGRIFGLSAVDWDNQIFFRDVVVREINKRTTQRTDYVDFLQLMMEAHQDVDTTGETKPRKISLTTSEIIANSLIFFFAGYETTATTLCLMAYLVALNQDVQDRIFQEVDDKLKGEKPNYDNVQELEYLEMCINETLRLYPPAARFDRMCTRDTEICGIPIRKGLNIFVPVYAIHHCSDYWKDPEEFDPERFSPENKKNINPLYFLPFGYGPRNCLGMRLALLEIKIAFARIIQELRFSAGKNTKKPVLQTAGILAPKSVILKVEKRN